MIRTGIATGPISPGAGGPETRRILAHPCASHAAASFTNSATLRAFIFSITFARCASTVLRLMPRLWAIIRFDDPSATKSMTRRWRGVSVSRRPMISSARALGPPLSVLLDAAVNVIQQELVAERLFDEIDGPRLHRAHRRRDICVTRNDDDRNLETHIAQSIELNNLLMWTRHLTLRDHGRIERFDEAEGLGQ